MPDSFMVKDHYSDHVRVCQARWEAALDAEGFDTAVIHSGSEITSFLDDYHYPFRPNPHFLQWLPLTRHHDSVLLVRAGRTPRLYYYQPDDYWYLPPSDPESWWADHFDVIAVRKPDAWKAITMNGGTACIGDAPQLREFSPAGQLNPVRLVNRMHIERTVKTKYEIACITQANLKAATAHRAAEEAFREGCSEFQIHQRYCQAAGLVEHELPYGNIVALNSHGAVLHYQQQDHHAPDASHSFLIDAGATQQGYCSDITRTHAAQAGEFAEMIEAMDAMQTELCGGMRPGADYRNLHVDTHHRIATILNQFGVIRISPDDAVASGLSSVFFPHGLGHFLGLQTHDVAGLIGDVDGTEIPRPEGHPFLRLTRVLEPGNVLTVEPGFYFIDTLLKRWRAEGDAAAVDWNKLEALAPCGGIRIEDNVVVTANGPLNLSRGAFASLSRH